MRIHKDLTTSEGRWAYVCVASLILAGVAIWWRVFG
jgi:hypothetical protein